MMGTLSKSNLRETSIAFYLGIEYRPRWSAKLKWPTRKWQRMVLAVRMSEWECIMVA
jgi:hypothetical protein